MTMGSEQDYIEEPTRHRNTGFARCVGCGAAITDQFILRVHPDMEWHERCLKCVQCERQLDESGTCFVRDGKTYCHEDYNRIFILRCAACGQAFNKSDYVMKARSKTYHMECFRCALCHRILQTGEEFALRNDGLFCMLDHEKSAVLNNPDTPAPVLGPAPPSCHRPSSAEPALDATTEATDLTTRRSPSQEKTADSNPEVSILNNSSGSLNNINNNNNDIRNNNNKIKPASLGDDRMQVDSPNSLSEASQDDSSLGGAQSLGGGHSNSSTNGGGPPAQTSTSGNNSGSGGGKAKRSKEQKTTRVRTVLNEKQLHTLRTCYGANPRPDALMKEQLVEMTGLSPRVIRVWFQNKRCKDKKKQILMKQMEQQQQNGMQRSLQGVPMVATSPMRNEASGQAIDIQQFPAPWKAEYAPLGPDVPSDQPPAFQQLVNAYQHPGLELMDSEDDDRIVNLDVPQSSLALGGQGSPMIIPHMTHLAHLQAPSSIFHHQHYLQLQPMQAFGPSGQR